MRGSHAGVRPVHRAAAGRPRRRRAQGSDKNEPEKRSNQPPPHRAILTDTTDPVNGANTANTVIRQRLDTSEDPVAVVNADQVGRRTGLAREELLQFTKAPLDAATDVVAELPDAFVDDAVVDEVPLLAPSDDSSRGERS
jgi:hypothetical protein